MAHYESVNVPTLTAETYRAALRTLTTQVAYTERLEPPWREGLASKVAQYTGEPIQIWLIREGTGALEIRLKQGLDTLTLSKGVLRALTEDVQSLVALFVELTGDETPFVSLRTVDDRYFTPDTASVSRDWHVDTSVLTLSTVYVGKGTEWIVESDLIHRYFEDKKILDVSHAEFEVLEIHRMKPYEVSVLKGEIRAVEDVTSEEFLQHFIPKSDRSIFNEHSGLIHRGPGYVKGDPRRLVLTVSTMHIPDWLTESDKL